MPSYKNKDKAEFLDRMIQEVKQIPVEKIVGSVVELHPKGQHLLGFCPFHPDHKLGSFVVTPSKNIWRCFTDNIGGTGISFRMMYEEVGFLDACFSLALEYGIISQEEHDVYSRKRYDSSVIHHYQRMTEERKADPVKKADDDVIHNVYSVMPVVCPLSEEHKKHLLEERRLTNLDDFFTFPNGHVDLAKKIIQEIKRMLAEKKFHKSVKSLTAEESKTLEGSRSLNRVREQICYVPGFYRNENGDTRFCSYKGIGFLVRDENGKARGIQVRKDIVKEGEPRYVWFSSSFAIHQENLTGGAPSGAPGGVIYPTKGTGTGALCVTEGRFKAEKIAEKGNTAIYLPGVSSWKNILQTIERLKTGNKVFLMFDADLMGNVAVHQQLGGLANALKQQGLNPYVILWPKDLGKGFDDYVINMTDTDSDYLKNMVTMSFDKFETKYQLVLKMVLESYGVDRIRDICGDPKLSEDFAGSMQRNVELACKCGTKTEDRPA